MLIKKIYSFKNEQKHKIFSMLPHIQKQSHLADFIIYVDESNNAVVISAEKEIWEKWMLSPCYPDSLCGLISILNFWQEITYPSFVK
jgi:hypothetical protein